MPKHEGLTSRAVMTFLRKFVTDNSSKDATFAYASCTNDDYLDSYVRGLVEDVLLEVLVALPGFVELCLHSSCIQTQSSHTTYSIRRESQGETIACSQKADVQVANALKVK